MPQLRDPGFWWAFGTLALLVAVPLSTVDYLPMVDLPQHAAQVSLLRDLALGRCGYDEVYRVNPFTPYWLGYGTSALLALAVPVDLALRFVLILALVALPLALRLLLRELGGDPWWSLAAFGASFGAHFGWGFLNFLVAVPVALLAGWLTLRQLRRPSVSGAVALAATAAGLLVAHGAAAAIGLLLCFLLAFAARGEGPDRRAIRSVLGALALPVGVALAWVLFVSRTEPAAREPVRFGAPVSMRWLELPRILTGLPNGSLAAGVLALLLVALCLSGARPARSPARWLPIGVAGLAYSLSPNFVLGTAHVYLRFLAFLLPCLLMACVRDAAKPLPAWRRSALPLAAAVSVLLGAARLAAFSTSSSGLREVLAEAPDSQRLLFLPLQRESPFALEPVYLHAGAWYQVDRCGLEAVSFATMLPQPVRYRAGQEPGLPRGFEWHARQLRWEAVKEQFDLFLVRSAEPVDPIALFGAPGRVELLARRGGWWLYCSRERPVESPAAAGRVPAL